MSYMCRHVPGSPAFLMNVEKLGVAWGQGYTNPIDALQHEHLQYHIGAVMFYLFSNSGRTISGRINAKL